MLLARTMGMTAEELTGRMTAQEFSEHWADFRMNPWDEQRADLRNGILASLFYNMNRGASSFARSAESFMPYREEPDESETRKRFIAQQKRRR